MLIDLLLKIFSPLISAYILRQWDRYQRNAEYRAKVDEVVKRIRMEAKSSEEIKKGARDLLIALRG